MTISVLVSVFTPPTMQGWSTEAMVHGPCPRPPGVGALARAIDEAAITRYGRREQRLEASAFTR